MTGRTRSSQTRTSSGASSESSSDRPTERLGWGEVPRRLRLALAIAVIGGVLAAIAPWLGVAELMSAGADGGPPRGYASGPVLVVLALLPSALAVGLVVARLPIAAAGVLVGSALLAPGWALVDLQFVVNALDGSRPELLAPTNLDRLTAGPGSWVLLAGHAAMIVAGLLAAGRAGAPPGSAMAIEFEESSSPVPAATDGATPGDTAAGIGAAGVGAAGVGAAGVAHWAGDSTEAAVPGAASRRRWLGAVFGLSVVTALGLLMPPFDSTNAFLPARDVMSSPVLVMVGSLLIALAVLVACAIVGSIATPWLARGVLLGVCVAVLAFVVPAQLAGFLVSRLSPDWRSYLALVGVLALILLALRPTRSDRRATRPDPLAETGRSGVRLHLAAGLFGLLAAAAAFGGGLGTLLVLAIPTDRPISATDRLYLLSGAQPVTYAGALLLPTGALLGLLSLLMVLRPTAPAVRPAFAVGCVAVPLAGMLALDAVVTASRTGASIRPGFGAWSAVLAIVFAAVAVGCAVLAGGVERDDVDLSEQGVNHALLAPAMAAILFAFGAFGLPTLSASDYVGAGVWSQFRLASWGLVVALLTVIAVAVVAVRSRPPRAAALLLGAAALVGVHALELPLTGSRVPGATLGQGTWLSLACIVSLVAGAIVALAKRPDRGGKRW